MAVTLQAYLELAGCLLPQLVVLLEMVGIGGYLQEVIVHDGHVVTVRFADMKTNNIIIKWGYWQSYPLTVTPALSSCLVTSGNSFPVILEGGQTCRVWPKKVKLSLLTVLTRFTVSSARCPFILYWSSTNTPSLD